MGSEEPQQIQLPLAWIGVDETPVAFANQFLIQHQPGGEFVLTVGQSTNPPLVGSPEQVVKQASEIEFVPIKTLGRFGFTRQRLAELIAILEASRDTFDQSSEGMDPRA